MHITAVIRVVLFPLSAGVLENISLSPAPRHCISALGHGRLRTVEVSALTLLA